MSIYPAAHYSSKLQYFHIYIKHSVSKYFETFEIESFQASAFVVDGPGYM